MKHELLVPVGNYASLIAAINNGADAVYLGGKRFGARAFANNFSDEELESVIKLCHLYEVKVYITVNTLIYEDEIKEALEYIRKIHKYGVDAVIMQDVGLINLVHQTFPNLEIHASTQMHNHSDQSLKFLGELGIKRVVFAREMPFEDINNLDTDLEKEVFIHGSLCISYSGQCLFSSKILNRSGNRGQCAGMCRLPYKLLENGNYIKTDGDYLLSPKDLCSISDFAKLMESNIKSFKIEGRMKSPAYVGAVTRIYKGLMNQYENGEELKVNEEDLNLLKAIFNREYTKGFLFNDYDIMNFDAPNHLGVPLGKVIDVTPKKIKIKLERNLYQFEGIRFKESNKGIIVNFLYDEKDNLINFGKKDEVIYLDNFIKLKNKDEVLLTTPLVKEEKEITKKIKINIKCEARVNQNLKMTISDGKNEITVISDPVERSLTSPVTKERIKNVLEKTGGTPFVVDKADIVADNDIFIAIGKLNALRREGVEDLIKIREDKKVTFKENLFKEEVVNHKEKHDIGVLVRNEEQIKACKDIGIRNIIVEDKKLMDSDFIYKVPRDNKIHNYNYENLLVTDYASLDKYPGNRADYYLNVTNHYTLNYLAKKASSIMLSPEMNLSQIKDLMNNVKGSVNTEVLVYGREELMLMKYCPLKKLVNHDKVCHACQNGNRYEFEDRNKAKYPIVCNLHLHSSKILNYEVTNRINELKELQQIGINNFRVEFYDESYEESKKVLEEIVNLL